MARVPPDEPEFLCGRCKGALCEDCASIAAEYEFLYQRRVQETLLANDRLTEAERETLKWKREAAMWEEISKVGYAAVIQAWMDDEIAKAKKAGRESMRREMEASGLLKKLRKAERLIKKNETHLSG